MSSFQWKGIASSLLVALAALLCMFFLQREEQTLPNYVTIIGSALSLIGLIFAFFQIRSVEEISRHTRDEVKLSLKRFNQVLSVADISRCIKIVEETQRFIDQGEYKLAQLRMRDIKKVLIQLESITDLESRIEKLQYQNIRETFILNLRYLNAYIDHNDEVEFKRIIDDLEDVSTLLNNYESRLKLKVYDV